MLNDTNNDKAPIVTAVHTHLEGGAPAPKGKLARAARKLKPKAPPVPTHEDPRAELHRLVNDHKALTKKATAIVNMCTDRTVREGPNKGAIIPSCVPEDRARDMKAVADALKKDANRLETAMLRELRKLPIYSLFLVRVFGLGPVVCAYLVALIDIQKATKPSNLRRFCGLAVINGRLERPTRGTKLGYCGELRTRLYQGFAAMWKNAAKKTAARPNGSTSKYLEVWRGYKERMLHSERYDAARNVLRSGRESGSEYDGTGVSDSTRADATGEERAVADERRRRGGSERQEGSERDSSRASESFRANATGSEQHPNPPGVTHAGRPGARAIIHATGWHKAADVLVEDIYTVWRAIEGLPVWPSYYAAKLGYNHGGSISVNAPRLLTVDEAVALVGEVGAIASSAPVEDVDMPEDLPED
jgi:hypothetical protein